MLKYYFYLDLNTMLYIYLDLHIYVIGYYIHTIYYYNWTCFLVALSLYAKLLNTIHYNDFI